MEFLSILLSRDLSSILFLTSDVTAPRWFCNGSLRVIENLGPLLDDKRNPENLPLISFFDLHVHIFPPSPASHIKINETETPPPPLVHPPTDAPASTVGSATVFWFLSKQVKGSKWRRRLHPQHFLFSPPPPRHPHPHPPPLAPLSSASPPPASAPPASAAWGSPRPTHSWPHMWRPSSDL